MDNQEFKEGDTLIYENGKYRLQMNGDRYTHAVFMDGNPVKIPDYHPPTEEEKPDCDHIIKLAFGYCEIDIECDAEAHFDYCPRCGIEFVTTPESEPTDE